VPDASLMRPCATVVIPDGRLTDNQIGELILDYDLALKKCAGEKQDIIKFIMAEETVSKK
jgi:hypothetical protein